MGWDMSNILVNMASNGGGSDPALSGRVANLETEVKDLEDANIYSATEAKIGKWGDDDLYRVVINDTFNINNATDYDLKLPSGAVVKRWSAFYLVNGNIVNLPYYATNSYCTPYIDHNNNHFKCMNASTANNANVTIIVDYTKPVAPTRKGGKK